MALKSIRGTLVNLAGVFLGTEDGERLVTDRFSAWRLADLAGKSKLFDALNHLQDGCWTLTASGAAKPHHMHNSVPQIGRLFPTDHGDELDRLPLTFDGGNYAGRLWCTADGGLVMLNDRLDLDGYTLKRHASGSDVRAVSVLRKDECIGILMPLRWSTGVLPEAAARLAQAVAQSGGES